MSAGWAQNPEFALPHLAERPRYRSRGVCRALFAFDFLLVAASMFVAGLAAAFLSSILSDTTSTTKADHVVLGKFFSLVVGFAAVLVPAVVAIWCMNRSHVRSWVMTLFACMAWAGCYVLGLHALSGEKLVISAMKGDPGSFIYLIFVATLVPIFASMLFQVVCSDAYRVYYEEHGKWGRQHFAFFKMGVAKRVAEVLELGNLEELARLRADGPNSAAPAWQAFTSMVLTVPDDNAPGPAYLHVKSIILGGGPLFSTRIHSCLGWSSLRHIELQPGEVDKIKWLFPELAPTGRSVPQMSSVPPLGGRVLGFQGSMSGDRVATANGSFIQKLDANEKRHLLGRFWFGFTLMFMMLFGGGFAIIILEGIGKSMGGWPSWTEPVGITIGAIWMITTMVVGVFFSKTARHFLVRGVRTRPNLRFTPTKKGSIVLNVEESTTFSKTKLFADDYALAHPSPQGLDIEFSSFRVHLDPRDVKLDYHAVGGGTGLRIYSVFPEGEWSITVSSPEAGMGFSIYMNPRKRAENLWRRIYDAMAKPQPTGPIIGASPGIDI